MAFAVVAGLALMLQQFVSKSAKQSRNFLVESSLTAIHSNMESHLRDDLAWQHTLQANPSLKLCMETGGDSACASGGQYELRNSANAVAFSSQNTTSGLKLSGELCSQFSTGGHDICSVRYELNWRALCESPCPPPVSVLLEGRMIYKSKNPEFKANSDTSRFRLTKVRTKI